MLDPWMKTCRLDEVPAGHLVQVPAGEDELLLALVVDAPGDGVARFLLPLGTNAVNIQPGVLFRARPYGLSCVLDHGNQFSFEYGLTPYWTCLGGTRFWRGAGTLLLVGQTLLMRSWLAGPYGGDLAYVNLATGILENGPASSQIAASFGEWSLTLWVPGPTGPTAHKLSSWNYDQTVTA